MRRGASAYRGLRRQARPAPLPPLPQLSKHVLQGNEGGEPSRACPLPIPPSLSLVTRGQCFGVWMLLEAKEERPRVRSCGAAVLCSQDVIVRFLRVQRSSGRALCIDPHGFTFAIKKLGVEQIPRP